MINLAIVDDQPIIREGLEFMFSKKEDIKVIGTGENGREAYELCKQHHVDVMLLDIKMPRTRNVQQGNLRNTFLKRRNCEESHYINIEQVRTA